MSLKKFESLELIAKGGMAEVYRARTTGAEGFAKDVCVKKILPHLTADEQFVGMFVNEAKLAATLSYANIVQVHDLCVSAEREYFIVMEYVHGKDLSDVIRAAQLAGKEVPPALAVYVAREVAKGLYYAHTKTDAEGAPLNIIHRDISPQNVLCSFMGEVKLTDFGIAKASSTVNKTAVGILKGKYGYMSPEQARGEPLDARSDLFCLGIVLYEMLVGERCFAGASDYSTLNLMREAQVTPPTKINKNIPKELEEIVLKALSKDKAARWQDALELEGALAAYASKSGEARPTDLSRFMKELFAAPEVKKSSTTGVLALSSIVGPAPSAPDPPKKPKRDSLPPEKAEKPAKKARPTEPPPAEAAPEAPAEPKPAAEAPAAEEPKKERKPARVKAAADGEKAEKPAKKAPIDRRPIARKDLKPGISKLAKLERRTGPRVAIALGLCVVAGAAGAAYGYRETQALSTDSALRELELRAKKGAPGEPTTMLWIDSDPPGATVVIDGVKLAATTPISVERAQDTAEHQLELTLEGFPALKRSFRFEPGPLTVLEETMPGDKGELIVRSKPSGLDVRVDGKLVGQSPLSIDVAHGLRKVELSGKGLEPLELEAEVRSGQKTTLERTLSSAARKTAASIVTTPPARLLVDGRDNGLRADGRPIALEPGVKHRVTVVDEARGAERDLWIQLEEGQQRTFLIEL